MSKIVHSRVGVKIWSNLVRAQPERAYEFPDQTGLDTQICRTWPAGPDWIGTYISNILPIQALVINSHWQRSLNLNLLSKVLNWEVLRKKIREKLENNFFGIFFSISKSVKSPMSGKENVQFQDSPNFENLPDFRTRHDVQ